MNAYRTAALDAALKAVCPIDGVSIGDWADKSTWRVDFKEEATPGERAAAQGVVDAFDPSATTAAESRAAADEAERHACWIDPTIMNLVNQTKAEWLTWAGANFPSLTTAEKNRLGTLFWVVSIGVRRAVRSG